MLAIDIKPIEIIDRDPEKGFFRLGPNRIMAVNIFTLGRFIKDISHLVDYDTRYAILTPGLLGFHFLESCRQFLEREGGIFFSLSLLLQS